MKNLENKEIKPGYLIKADGIGWGYVTKNKGILVVVLCVLEALCYPLDGLHILAVYKTDFVGGEDIIGGGAV